VAGGEAVHAFHFDNEQVLDEEAGEVAPDRVAFVGDGQGSLGGGADAAEGKSEESGTEGVRDFEDCGENAPGERIAVAGFICVHLCSSVAKFLCWHRRALLRTFWATDEHR
jgi:hypothetical protein